MGLSAGSAMSDDTLFPALLSTQVWDAAGRGRAALSWHAAEFLL